MVKKVIGCVAVVAVIAIVVFTAMNVGGYKSILPEGWFSSSTQDEIVIEVESVQLDRPAEWDESADMPDSLIRKMFNTAPEVQE